MVELFFGLQDLHARFEQFCTNDQRHNAGEAKECKRRDQIHVPDRFMVSRGQPVHDNAAFRDRYYLWSNTRLSVVLCVFVSSHVLYSSIRCGSPKGTSRSEERRVGKGGRAGEEGV